MSKEYSPDFSHIEGRFDCGFWSNPSDPYNKKKKSIDDRFFVLIQLEEYCPLEGSLEEIQNDIDIWINNENYKEQYEKLYILKEYNSGAEWDDRDRTSLVGMREETDLEMETRKDNYNRQEIEKRKVKTKNKKADLKRAQELIDRWKDE